MSDDEHDEQDQPHFIWTSWRKTELTYFLRTQGKKSPVKLLYNRLEDNFHLSNKKALFLNLKSYYGRLGLDPFEVAIPLTFNIKSVTDPEYMRFCETFMAK
jgi:hypothetical protein